MKKLVTGLLAALLTVSVSVAASAAETTAYQDETNSIVLSDSISQQNMTLTLNDISTTATYYTVSVGTTVSLTGDQSNIGEIGRRVFTKQSDGTYLSTWTADPHIDDFWKATSDLSGKLVHIFAFTNDLNERELSVYFFVDGSGQTPSQPTSGNSTGDSTPPASTAPTTPAPDTASPAAPAASASFKSDTGAKVSLGTQASYQFKITSLDGKKPTFAIPGNAFRVAPNGNKGNDYFFKVTAVGKTGDSAGVYINGSKTPSTILSISDEVKIDTGKNVAVKPGKTYQFKLTSNTKPAFISGNSKVFEVAFTGNSGNDYYYQVKAVGKAGQGAGLYLNGSKTPVSIATIE